MPGSESKGARKWRTIGEQFFKFVKVGDQVEGVLESAGIEQFQNATVGRYTLVSFDGRKAFLGSTVLDRMMSHVKEGQYVRVIYSGDETSKGGRKVRQWQVEVADDSEEGSE